MDKVRLQAALGNGTFSQDEIAELEMALETQAKVQALAPRVTAVNWGSLITGILSLIGAIFGGSTPTPSPAPSPAPAPTPTPSPLPNWAALLTEILSLFGVVLPSPGPAPVPAPAPSSVIKPTPLP